MQLRFRRGAELGTLDFGGDQAYMECPDATSLRATAVQNVTDHLGVVCGNYVEVAVDGEQQAVCRLKARLAHIDPEQATPEALRTAVVGGEISCSLEGTLAQAGGHQYTISVFSSR